jgi:hypothetical protein
VGGNPVVYLGCLSDEDVTGRSGARVKCGRVFVNMIVCGPGEGTVGGRGGGEAGEVESPLHIEAPGCQSPTARRVYKPCHAHCTCWTSVVDPCEKTSESSLSLAGLI